MRKWEGEGATGGFGYVDCFVGLYSREPRARRFDRRRTAESRPLREGETAPKVGYSRERMKELMRGSESGRYSGVPR